MNYCMPSNGIIPKLCSSALSLYLKKPNHINFLQYTSNQNQLISCNHVNLFRYELASQRYIFALLKKGVHFFLGPIANHGFVHVKMKGQSCVRKGGGKEDERTRKGRKDKYDMKKRERRKQEKKGKERGRGSSASHSERGKENE